MTEFNKRYWEERYAKQHTTWDAGAITTPLKAYFDQLEDKSISILIPGAGNAYEAEYLYNKGFTNVGVIDIAEAPLQNFRQRVPGFPEERLLLEDFFAHNKTYDLIIEQTFFCALDIRLRMAYAEKMHDLLNTKGKLVGVLFNREFNSEEPPFGGSAEEYKVYFAPYFEFKVFGECYNSIPPRKGKELFVELVRK